MIREMIVTNTNHQVEDNKSNMVLLSQFYPSDVLTPTGIVPQQGEPSKPKRRQRKRNTNGNGGFRALKKRKLTAEQAELLEMHFGNEHKLESDRKDKLAAELGLDPRQVAVWFQNRRARDKTKKIEETYATLKTAHENVVVEKTRLESEVATLKEKLSVAEKEIKKMSELIEGISLNNPSATIPTDMDTVDSPFTLDPFASNLGWFDYEDLLYLLQQNYISAAEWLLLHTY
ncbi:hypothetical protein CUMW_069310 [Citrus unshiu]|nr:hypothetical protein CUMW_069310 [Citrus unshiu]